MLAQENVAFTDVQTINVGWALSSSLASGKVDAIWGGLRNFETNQLALEGYKAKAFFLKEHRCASLRWVDFCGEREETRRWSHQAFNKALEQATTYIVNRHKIHGVSL